jgi:DNA invertase Pin-like site-specific DNA recombinase
MLIDGYVRVSQVSGRSGARFISPIVQREQIEGWAKLHGAVVGEVFEELDESGARADRPLLMRAIERVEANESDGIVVAKLDRFGRSLVDSLAGIERIRKAGGTFEVFRTASTYRRTQASSYSESCFQWPNGSLTAFGRCGTRQRRGPLLAVST